MRTKPRNHEESFKKMLSYLRPIFSNAAIGNFSEVIEIPDETNKDFLEIYTGINIMLEIIQEKISRMDAINTELIQAVNDLEESKVKNDAIILAIGDGLVVTDAQGKIIIVNAFFEKMLGWKFAEVYGKKMSDIIVMKDESGTITPEKERKIIQILSGALQMYANTYANPFYFVCKNKTRFPVAFVATPIRLKGKIIGAVELFRDITKERELDKAKTEFVFIASHQLRTPLSAIKWYGEMLSAARGTDLLGEKSKKYLAAIYRNTDRMITLINSLLSVSRIELGKIKMRPEMTTIKSLINDILKDQEYIIKKKKQTVTVLELNKTSPVMTDPKLLTTVLQNIISNAVKYTRQHGRIIITIQSFATGVEVKCKDTGIGIPQDQQSKIFQKFFRSDNAISNHPEGTGLGLYIAKSIISILGGTISFTSHDLPGTTFVITLPFKKL